MNKNPDWNLFEKRIFLWERIQRTILLLNFCTKEIVAAHHRNDNNNNNQFNMVDHSMNSLIGFIGLMVGFRIDWECFENVLIRYTARATLRQSSIETKGWPTNM